MKAILVDKNKALIWSEVPDPVIKENEVLIKVKAAGVNRADLMQRAGDYPPPADCPEWLGLEVAGEIIKLGSEAAKHRRLGDRVCALLGGGGYAEYVAVRYDMTLPIPKGVSMFEAAAIPEAFATAYLNLFWEGQAKPGETLLVTAGGSGLASVIIPMAKVHGMRVITTVRSAEKAAAIAHLKPDRIVISSNEDLSAVMKCELEAGSGVNLAIDCVGGEMVSKCLPYMEREGRWIMIAALAGEIAPVDLRMLYVRATRLIGNTLRARSPELKASILSALAKEFWPAIEAGEIRPTIFKALPIEQAEEAHAILQKNLNVGKVVLTIE